MTVVGIVLLTKCKKHYGIEQNIGSSKKKFKHVFRATHKFYAKDRRKSQCEVPWQLKESLGLFLPDLRSTQLIPHVLADHDSQAHPAGVKGPKH